VKYYYSRRSVVADDEVSVLETADGRTESYTTSNVGCLRPGNLHSFSKEKNVSLYITESIEWMNEWVNEWMNDSLMTILASTENIGVGAIDLRCSKA